MSILDRTLAVNCSYLSRVVSYLACGAQDGMTTIYNPYLCTLFAFTILQSYCEFILLLYLFVSIFWQCVTGETLL